MQQPAWKRDHAVLRCSPAKYNQNQDALVLQSELRPKQQHFHGVLVSPPLQLSCIIKVHGCREGTAA